MMVLCYVVLCCAMKYLAVMLWLYVPLDQAGFSFTPRILFAELQRQGFTLEYKVAIDIHAQRFAQLWPDSLSERCAMQSRVVSHPPWSVTQLVEYDS